MKKTLARHKWLANCIINEMIDTKTEQRYFVATVCGWSGFYLPYLPTDEIIYEVKSIRDKIENGDSSVFKDSKYYKKIYNAEIHQNVLRSF